MVHNQQSTRYRSEENDPAPTNSLVDEHNETAPEAFPVSAFNLFSSTTVESHTLPTERQQNPGPEYLVPEMT